MVASKTLSALLLGAGAAVAFPHAGHHGHCGSKCSTSSGVVAPTGAFPFAPFGHGKPHGTGKPFGAGAPFGTGKPYATGKPFPTGATGGANKVAATGTAALGTAVSAPLSTGTATPGSAGNSSGTVDASSVGASSACTFTDADTAASGKADCKNIVLSGITVPAGKTLDMTDLADGTTVTFEGTTTFEYEEWKGPLMSFSGSGITIQGAEGHTIDGNGAKWWDGEGSNGGKTKPKFCYLHKLIDSTVTGLNVLNTPVQGFSINGAQNMKVVDISIDNTAGDGEDGGHNTDAFDVGSSTGVYISGAKIQNQDDCLAINSGTDISFTGGTCSGGHGISIGSVGGRDDNDVANVYIADNSITNSDNGVRIKTVSDATGSVKNVTYSNIKLSNIAKRGIVIEQDYENGSPTGTPTGGVPITDLTIENVTGTVASDADNILILCAACTGWTWTGVSITGGETGECVGVPSGASC